MLVPRPSIRVRLTSIVGVTGLALGVLSSTSWAHDSARLTSPGGSEMPRGEARIGGDDEIRVRGEGLPASIGLSVRMEDSAGVLREAFTPRSESNGSFDVRARAGALPLGEEDAGGFRGRRVEVADEKGKVLLAGKFPVEAARAEAGVGFAPLVPPAGSPFPDGSGRIRVKAQGGRHALEVKVRGLAEEATFQVCIIDAAGTLEPIGKITTQGGGNGALKIDTADGGTLPLGASGIAQLAGLKLQVKDAGGGVVLEGTIPALGEELAPEAEVEVEFDLTRPENPPEPGIEGEVNLRSEAGDDRVRVRIDGAAAGKTYRADIHRLHDPRTLPFAAVLAGSQEVPPVDTAATGAGRFSYDSTARTLSFTIEFSGLSTPEAAAHIHSAPAGEPGPVVFPLAPASPKTGSVVLDEAQEATLLAWGFYVNIHSEAHPAGEIRGQILPVAPARERIAELKADGGGEAEFEERGADVLPLGASSVRELSGAVVEVTNEEGKLVLSGRVPAAPAPPVEPPPPVEPLEFDVVLQQPDLRILPRAHGEVEFEEEGDEHEIEVEVEDLKPGATFRVELRRPDGAAEVLAEGPADAEGDQREEIEFFGAERLPFGVKNFREYGGFSIAVLDADGKVVLTGRVALPAGGGGAGVLPPVSFSMVGKYDTVFLRGDSNRDFRLDITDPIATLDLLFRGGAPPRCADALDASDDGRVDISDPISTLFYLFVGERVLPFPGASLAGFDPTPDRLLCDDTVNT